MKEALGCDEECWWGKPAAAVQVGSDGGSSSLKECYAVSCVGVVPARGG